MACRDFSREPRQAKAYPTKNLPDAPLAVSCLMFYVKHFHANAAAIREFGDRPEIVSRCAWDPSRPLDPTEEAQAIVADCQGMRRTAGDVKVNGDNRVGSMMNLGMISPGIGHGHADFAHAAQSQTIPDGSVEFLLSTSGVSTVRLRLERELDATPESPRHRRRYRVASGREARGADRRMRPSALLAS